ncbi:hypothetical protein FSARC_13803 [Fusarium sarcochroum]|uniref:Amidoligase enzyme-domain-containing protein n=1 Tax=Fusarium sarcochroum TaxID=1208366 RepID=A0A8H4SYZ5_9HYPO|nr:hypothetical protein FSARC_13803 [Fusarium sarcochroum]
MAPLPWQGITFGVELEFMTPCPNNKRLWKSLAPAAAARLNIAELLAKATNFPIACECVHDIGRTCPICDQTPERHMYGETRVLNFPSTVPNGTILRDCCFLFKPEFLVRKHKLTIQRNWPGVEFSTPIFHSGELRSGLPTMNSVLSNIRQMGLDITADNSCGMHVHVGIEGGMTLLLAQKITTLVMLLENTLLLRLVSPIRWVSDYAEPVCESSRAATGIWSMPNDTKLFEKHIPPMSAMQPGKWNKNDVDRYYGMFGTVWSAQSLQSLAGVIRKGGYHRCAFTLALRNRDGKHSEIMFKKNLENSPSTVEFRYSQMTFDHALMRNWTEVVARIVVLAQADAGKFKECVELIMQLHHEAEVDGKTAWKLLLKYVLKLEHRIPEWEAQLAKFKRGEHISHLDENLLLMSD